MIRGLVTPRHEPDSAFLRGIGLDRSAHRELHEAVAEASWRVGAPKPDEIRVNHRPACCAAEFRKFGVRTQRRLVVVLGLPILTVFNVSELKVILGHELAHIGRGDTRLEVFMVRVLEMLRRQVPHERRCWWRWLDPLVWYAWASATLLAALLGPMWRHQELRADSLSAAAYGGDLAAQTLLKDWLAVHEFAQAVLSFGGDGCHDTGWSTQSVFHRFAQRWQEFSRVGQEYLERRLQEEERPSFWDSHPTVYARTTAMRRFAPRDGEDRRPARELLPDFDDLAAKLHEAALDDDVGTEDADSP
jgi:Zn-dependent protease with chaperone function